MKLSEKAIDELAKILKEKRESANGIRIYNSQGCCGPSIQMDVARQPKNDETTIKIDGIEFYIENALIDTMETVTIDHNGFGFLLKGLNQNTGGCCC